MELEAGWSLMRRGIDKLKKLLENEPEESFTAQEYMTLYTTIYNMCTQKPPHDYSKELYERYKQSFSTYIAERVLPSLKGGQGEFLLKELCKRWTNHKIMVRWLSRFFNYLDRYYIQRQNLSNLNDVGLLGFRDDVYNEIKKRTKDAILVIIDQEREGEQVDRALLKNVLEVYISLGMGNLDTYVRDFEEHLLVSSTAFYKRKAAQWIEEDSCPDYMIKAEDSLRLEEERVGNYLHINTKPKLLKVVEQEVLTTFEMQLLEKEQSGCAVLLQDDKKEHLARMYRLFNRIKNGLDPVALIFRKHVESEGMKIVNQATEDATAKKEKDAGKPSKEGGAHEQQFVRQVIELHDKYLLYVTECFANSSLFHKALKEAFENFCNKSVAGATTAELMASFCDNLLKKGGTEKLSDEAIEDTLEKVVKLLAYISDKDLFAEFYRKKLARRLLFDKSSSDDHERAILARLKQQCGAQFTSKMEGMVTDLQLARDKQQQFEEWRTNQNKSLKIDLIVTVLTTGFWPSYKATDLALPQEMVDGVEQFKEFYEASVKHRKLTWIYSLGNCHLKGNFDAKPIELIITTSQAALLLLFNEGEQLTYNEVKERLNAGDDDVLRLLHSLSCAKHKVLLKEPAGKTIAKTDSFRLNVKFTDRMRRVKIPLPPVDERKKVVEDVDKDRRYAIDAAVVRTMKSRKVLKHQQLVLEVVQQLQRMFHPDFRLIKKRIEDLISREYLERDKEDPNTFKYMA